MNLLLLSKYGSCFVTRPTLNDYLVGEGEFEERITEIVQWIAEGKLKVRIDSVFALANSAASHTYMESRKGMGKILIAVSNDQQDQVTTGIKN
jgi:NADPH2:quinone reductase